MQLAVRVGSFFKSNTHSFDLTTLILIGQANCSELKYMTYLQGICIYC